MENFASNVLLYLEIGFENWCRDVLSVTPPSVRRLLNPDRVYFDPEVKPPHRYTADQPVILSVDPAYVLVQILELPNISRFQLSSLMKFEIGRQVPVHLHLVQTDFRVVKRDLAASKITVELAILRIEVGEKLKKQARDTKLQPEGILIRSDFGDWISQKLIRVSWQKLWLARQRMIRVLRIVFLALWCIVIILLAQRWADRYAANRSDEVTLARIQAENVEPIKQKLLASDEKVAFLVAQENMTSASKIIDTIARVLPDGTWLQEFDLEPGRIRLIGTSEHATDLLSLFSSSPLFSNIQFEAPLTPASNGTGDQFDLSLKIK